MTVTDQRPHASSSGISVTSLPARLRQIARKSPDKVALRSKVHGIWQETTYGEYWEMVQVVGMGLRAVGVEPGDAVAIHSENRKEWVYADLGSQATGAISVGLYPTNPPAEVEYLLAHSEAVVLIAEDQEQVDKVMQVRSSLPGLKKIIYVEPRGVRRYDDSLLMSWEELIAMGRDAFSSDPTLIPDFVDQIDPDQIAAMAYTSGTTGPPKGAMLSHRNFVWVAENIGPVLAPHPPRRVELLSYLPLCHVFEKLYTFLLALELEATVNFAESIDTVVQDLQEVQPTYFPAVPRIWEKLHAGVLIRMADASRIKKLAYRWAIRSGMRNADRVLTSGKRGTWGNVTHWLFYVLVYRSLQEKLGMRHSHGAVSGAAPIASDVLKFFMALGVPIQEGYGQTENTAYATFNPLGNVKLGTVGVPNPGAEIELAEGDNEILFRHPAVFRGYFKDEEATAASLTPDGWLHTGDVGEWDGSHLRIVDRKKDIIITAGGKNLSPSEIENKLKVSPYVKEAIVIGDGRRFISALIGIEYDTCAQWAQRQGITFTTLRDLSLKPELRELIQQEIDRANEDLSRVAQVREFRILSKELDHEDGELTATQKVKRARVETLFGPMIDDIYGRG